MRFIVTGVIVCLCLVTAIYVGYLRVQMDKPTAPTYVITAGLPDGGDFQLTNHKGELTKPSDFLGKVVLLYFGYTYCPDFCPTELAEMTQALNLLGDKAKNVQPLFVTIDPTRDTQSLMADYVKMFHPSLIGLCGSEADIKKACDLYKVYATKTNDHGDDSYQMDHSTFIYLVGKDGKLVSLFRYGTPAEVMAAEVRKML